MFLGQIHCNSLFSNVYLQVILTLKNISTFYNLIFLSLIRMQNTADSMGH